MKKLTDKQLIRLDAKKVNKNTAYKKQLDSLYTDLHQAWHGYKPGPKKMADEYTVIRLNFCRAMEDFYAI